MSDVSASLQRRGDVDGLRAVAVLSVILFHLDVPPFSGGFVGVDIFFVISGYLITRIVAGDITRGAFSLSDFYVRRIRRIFPALYLTIVLTLMAAWWLYEPPEWQLLMGSLRSLTIFSSNFFFAAQGGYFDAPLESQALLQTWSLSVEEQFYIVYPLVLLFLLRQSRSATMLVLALIAIVGFVAGDFLVGLRPQQAFFNTLLRIPELLTGALVAIIRIDPPASGTVRSAIAGGGLALIVASILLLHSGIPFPGLTAVPVCVGTALIIWTGETGLKTRAHRLLASRPLVAIGLISYSAYLLHWPMIVFAKRLSLDELTSSNKVAILVATLVAASLSWRYVEQPFRTASFSRWTRKTVLRGAALLIVLTFASSHLAHVLLESTSLPILEVQRSKRMAERDSCILHIEDRASAWSEQACIVGTGPAVAIWGDSHAAHYFRGFRQLAQAGKARVMLLAASACPPASGLEVAERPNCEAFNSMALKRILETKPRAVVLSANWLNYEKRRGVRSGIEQSLRETVSAIRAKGIGIIVLGPSPTFPIEVPLLAGASSGAAARGTYQARNSAYFEQLFEQMQGEGAIKFINVSRIFCPAMDRCRFRDNDRLLFWDRTHLTAAGADLVLPLVIEQLSVIPD